MLYSKMARKMFCDKEEGLAYPLSSWLDSMEENQEDGIELQLMRHDYSYMWCHETGIFPGIGDCGFGNCKGYKPRNGKNGCCRNLVPSYVNTGKWYRLFINRKLEEIDRENK